MKRLARTLFTLCSTASLLLCVAACTLWVRSYHRLDAINLVTSDRSLAIAAPTARLWFVYDTRPPLYAVSPDATPFRDIDAVAPGWTGIRRTGAIWWTHTPILTAVVVPTWMVAGLTAALPALWLAGRWCRRHRERAGFCASCGYDLRASPGRCPECGTPAATAANAEASAVPPADPPPAAW
jgi:hypothetical protein